MHHSEDIFSLKADNNIQIDVNMDAYLDELNRCIFEISKCHIAKSSPVIWINKLKSLESPVEVNIPPLIVYLQDVADKVTPKVIEMLKYLFLYDASMLEEMRPYYSNLLKYACDSDNVCFFDFLIEHAESEIDWVNILIYIIRTSRQNLINHISTANIIPVTEKIQSDLREKQDTFIYFACQFASIEFFKWLYSRNTFSFNQGFILNHVCCSGKIELLEWLIKDKGFDVNASLPNGTTPLMSVIKSLETRLTPAKIKARQAKISLLLKHGANIFRGRDDGSSAFHLAIQLGDGITICALDAELKRQGHSLKDIKNKIGQTTIHWAIIQKKINLIPLLVKLLGEDIKDSYGLNLTTFACIYSSPEVTEFILKNYPQISLRDKTKFGVNVLHHICGGIHFNESVTWLIEKKNFPLEEVTDCGDTALLMAGLRRNYSIIDYLISLNTRAINMQARNNSKKHIGHIMAEAQNIDLTLKLIAKHPLQYLAEDINGKTMIDIALIQGESHYPVVKACLLKIQNSNKQTRKNAKKLFRKKELLPLFLKFFAHAAKNEDPNDLYQQDKLGDWVLDNQTPLHLLAVDTSIDTFTKNFKTLKLDINLRNSIGQTVICYMLTQNALAKAKLIVERFSPNITDIDDNGSSILQVAVELAQLSMTEWCIENLDISILDKRKDGLSALDLAIKKSDNSIASLLWGKIKLIERLKYFAKSNEENKKYIKQNLKFNPYDLDGLNILQFAVNNRKVKLVKACLDTKLFTALDKDQQEQSILDIAIDMQDVVISEILFASLSPEQCLAYLLNISPSKQTFLIDNGICQINLHEIVDEFSKGIVKSVCNEVIEDTVNEQQKEYSQLINDLADVVINEYITTSEKEVMLAIKIVDELVECIIDDAIDSIQDFEDISHADSDEYYTTTSSDSGPVVYNEMHLLDAVKNNDFNFFFNLEGDSKYNSLLANSAVKLLEESIRLKHIKITKFLLDISIIRKNAHHDDNNVLAIAKAYRCGEVVDILLKIPNVQRTMTQGTIEFTSPRDACWPMCYFNPFYKIVLDELRVELLAEEFKKLRALLYGSANYKNTPNDLDILFYGINTPELKNLVKLFIDRLCEARGASLVVRNNSKKPAARQVIPIEWMNCRIEFIVTEQTQEMHAQGLDFRINATYYDIVNETLFEAVGNNAWVDLKNGIIDTITSPRESFQDLSRIFRGVRIMSACQGFSFSQRCKVEIARLFSSTSNPFLDNNMQLSQMYRLLSEIFSAHHSKVANLTNLHQLNILPYIIDFLLKTKGDKNYELASALQIEGKLIIMSEQALHQHKSISPVRPKKGHKREYSSNNTHTLFRGGLDKTSEVNPRKSLGL